MISQRQKGARIVLYPNSHKVLRGLNLRPMMSPDTVSSARAMEDDLDEWGDGEEADNEASEVEIEIDQLIGVGKRQRDFPKTESDMAHHHLMEVMPSRRFR